MNLGFISLALFDSENFQESQNTDIFQGAITTDILLEFHICVCVCVCVCACVRVRVCV